MKLAKNAGRHSAVEALLLATLGDHAQVRHRHMSMFGRILVDSVFFCLRLGVFLHAMHFGMGHHAGNRNCMTDMIAEVRRLNPKPGLAFGSAIVQPIVPDVFVRPGPDGGWLVELNSDTLPKVLINQSYYSAVSKTAKKHN